jgi:hypothetical protein
MSKVADMLLKRVDVRGLVMEDIMIGIIKTELEKIVKDSSNSYDDAMFAFVYPILEDAAKKFIDEQLVKIGE